MGYFSRLALEHRERYAADRSFPTQRERLVWRLEDLESRLEELMQMRGRDYLCAETGYRLIDELCRTVVAHTLPEHLKRPEDVLLAIEMTREQLRALDGGDEIAVVAVLPGQLVLASMYAHQKREEHYV